MSDKYLEIVEDLKAVLVKHKSILCLSDEQCNSIPDSLVWYIFFVNRVRTMTDQELALSQEIFDWFKKNDDQANR